MAIGWWDCQAGAAGDMCLGALVDAGAPLDALQAAVDAVPVGPVLLSQQTVNRHGVAATLVDVRIERSSVVRTWANIRDLLEAAALPDRVRTIALAAFGRLADAEAAAHRTAPDQVHFHEVGGQDAVADIVGTAAGLHALGIDRLFASPVALGSGMTRGEHGLLPVPTPAVLALLREAGAPVLGGRAPYELCTPTGAALLAATVTGWGELPQMRVRAVGVGAGSRDLAELPNVLRIVVGDPTATPSEAGQTSAAVVVEANVDDLDPRLWPGVLTSLLAAGAADAWLTPILMKKGRPAHTLAVLTTTERLPALRRVIFEQTSTIGLREHPVRKHALDRETVTIDLRGVPIRVKLARLDGVVVTATPEYDDLAAAATELGVPVTELLTAASSVTRSLVERLPG